MNEVEIDSPCDPARWMVLADTGVEVDALAEKFLLLLVLAHFDER